MPCMTTGAKGHVRDGCAAGGSCNDWLDDTDRNGRTDAHVAKRASVPYGGIAVLEVGSTRKELLGGASGVGRRHQRDEVPAGTIDL